MVCVRLRADDAWIIASVALIVGIAFLTGMYWRGYGQRVNAAISSGDATAVREILTDSVPQSA